jgi:hypothetical protein
MGYALYQFPQPPTNGICRIPNCQRFVVETVSRRDVFGLRVSSNDTQEVRHRPRVYKSRSTIFLT